ncbi:MAG: sigma-70 family RNA polymerase sigma factor [Prevotella sp.]|nr:sigma-70 family RNA polymerase sigma factor [Prevotella sp.]MCM1074257.1 sigma-70 family RNA polymerase sigma factor [Ruminococcus sp.]
MDTEQLKTDEKKLVAELQDPKLARQAFNRLMQAYGEQIYWQIRKMVVSHEDADDLLQNTFLKAWNNLHNFRGDAKLSTWLYKIAVNESINFLNKERKNQAVRSDTEDENDSFLIRNLQADEYFDGDELQIQLQQAIASLPEKQRLVFNMRYFDDMKYEQISEILGTSVGALKANYHHAVKKIEEYITALD